MGMAFSPPWTSAPPSPAQRAVLRSRGSSKRPPPIFTATITWSLVKAVGLTTSPTLLANRTMVTSTSSM